jgi:hypothetical protein
VTALEQRLHEALVAGAADVYPAPDLFARVRTSIEDDRRRRRRTLRAWAIVGFAVAALVLAVVATADVQEGRVIMEWWVLELITLVVLVAMALWLGPFIKRFGRSYAADVFRSNPRTGKSFIVLVDVVYYLIFTAYIFFTVRFEPELGWGETVGADQLQYEVARVGGILLIIGVLHGANLLLMPVLGRLFSLNRRLDERVPPQDS